MARNGEGGDLEDQVTRQETVNLLCRDLGHAWQPHRITPMPGGYEVTLDCARGCQVNKTRIVDRVGWIVRSRMDYKGSPDYLLKGTGQLTRSARALVRGELFGRLAQQAGVKPGRAKRG